jgi:hypothetical protein
MAEMLPRQIRVGRLRLWVRSGGASLLWGSQVLCEFKRSRVSTIVQIGPLGYQNLGYWRSLSWRAASGFGKTRSWFTDGR